MRRPLVGVLLVLTAACSATVPKAELIVRGDTICAELNDQIDRLAGAGDDDGVPVGPYFEAFARLLSEAVEEIKAIGAPEEDAETFDVMLAHLDHAVENLEEAATALGEQDDETADAAAQAAFAGIEAFNRLAEDFGFEDCAG